MYRNIMASCTTGMTHSERMGAAGQHALHCSHRHGVASYPQQYIRFEAVQCSAARLVGALQYDCRSMEGPNCLHKH